MIDKIHRGGNPLLTDDLTTGSTTVLLGPSSGTGSFDSATVFNH